MTLTFDLLTQKSIEIIYGSWPSLIPRKVYLGEISLKSMSGQDFANAGQWTDTQRDRQTDNVCHKIIRPKVPSGI